MALTVEAIRVDRVLLHMKVHSDFDYFYSRGLTKGQETVGEYSKRAQGWDGLDGRLWFLANSHFKQAWTTRRQGRKVTLGLKDRRKGRTDKPYTQNICYILEFKLWLDIHTHSQIQVRLHMHTLTHLTHWHIITCLLCLTYELPLLRDKILTLSVQVEAFVWHFS